MDDLQPWNLIFLLGNIGKWFRGTFLPQTTSYVEENEKKNWSLRQTRKSPLSRRNGKRQPANVENGGKTMVTWSLWPFAFHVNMMLIKISLLLSVSLEIGWKRISFLGRPWQRNCTKRTTHAQVVQGPVHTYRIRIFLESATFPLRPHAAGESGMRIRNFFNPLSRLENLETDNRIRIFSNPMTLQTQIQS